MRSGLIVREVRESIIGSRLGPALTVRFVRVHEGSLEARTPPHPPHPPAPPAPLLHPLHTPHAPRAHPMHPVVRRRSEAILAARVHAVCSSAGSRPSRSMRRRPATRHRTSLRHRPRARPPDPDTPTPTHRPRHTEHGPAPPTVYSLRLPCCARRSCTSSRPPRGAGMSSGCASRTARPPNPNPNPNPNSSPEP